MIILCFFYFISVGLEEEQYRAMFMFSPPNVGNGIT